MTDYTNASAEQCVARFIEIRNLLKKLEETFELRIAPLKGERDALSERLNTILTENKATSVKTSQGTAIASVRYSASLADPDIFMRHVISTGAYELLDRKANATAVKEYVKKHSVLPPGVNLSPIRTIGVRSPQLKGIGAVSEEKSNAE